MNFREPPNPQAEFIAAFDRSYTKAFAGFPKAPPDHAIGLRGIAKELGMDFNSPAFKNRVEGLIEMGGKSPFIFAPDREAKNNLLIRMPGELHEQSMGLATRRPVAKAGVPPVKSPVAPAAPPVFREPPAESNPGKEPWQMTKAEYVDGHVRSPAMHKYGVQKALSEGKPVPPEVLKDYPDLAKSNPGDERLLVEEAAYMNSKFPGHNFKEGETLREAMAREGFEWPFLPTGWQPTLEKMPGRKISPEVVLQKKIDKLEDKLADLLTSIDEAESAGRDTAALETRRDALELQLAKLEDAQSEAIHKAEAVTHEVKEPWQMTQAEYSQWASSLEKRYNEILGGPVDPQSPVGREAEQRAFSQLKKETGLTQLTFTDMAGWGHKAKVRLALSEGKPVPPEVLKDYPDLAKSNPGDERLFKVAIELEPLRVAKQWGYEVHRLSPKDVVDKEDYARGYRYRLSKADPTQPYPQIVMARSEGEVATFLKRQIGGDPHPEVGTCYEDAWRFVIKEEEGDLIHGIVESKGKRIGHAWVELPTGFIWEPETGKYFTREAFNIAASPIEEHRYTVEEAAIMLARVGKHGPWTEEERLRILKGGNPMPRTESERLSFHERIFGKGSTPPLERLGRGQTVNDLLPMPPESGPPLPRALGLRWPWKK